MQPLREIIQNCTASKLPISSCHQESCFKKRTHSVTEANEVMCSLLKISSVRLNKKQEVMLLRLDRPSALTAVICGILERGVFWHRKERSGVAGRFENCEISSRMGKTSELSALRCSMVAGCLDRLSGDLHQDEVNEKKARIRVGCADKNYLENNNEERTGYVQVGVVKSGRLGLASVYERLFDKYLSVARERETEMGEAQRLRWQFNRNFFVLKTHLKNHSSFCLIKIPYTKEKFKKWVV